MTSHSRPRHWLFRVKRKLVSVEVPVRAAANSFVLLAELRAVLVPFAPEPIDWHAVYPSTRNLRLFVDLLEQHFRR